MNFTLPIVLSSILLAQGRGDTFIGAGLGRPGTYYLSELDSTYPHWASRHGLRVDMANASCLSLVKIDIFAKLRIWAEVLDGSVHDTANVLR